jgi:hypothetical protein
VVHWLVVPAPATLGGTAAFGRQSQFLAHLGAGRVVRSRHQLGQSSGKAVAQVPKVAQSHGQRRVGGAGLHRLKERADRRDLKALGDVAAVRRDRVDQHGISARSGLQRGRRGKAEIPRHLAQQGPQPARGLVPRTGGTGRDQLAQVRRYRAERAAGIRGQRGVGGVSDDRDVMAGLPQPGAESGRRCHVACRAWGEHQHAHLRPSRLSALQTSFAM